ncbi:hypothetical protein B0T21DRAFT_447580 [Apiosordaria backusii]|uniref:DUF7779 domain-containing protein n=1 Tax=Apiosordaria backusii TaxID=314023 RepID=A0AA40K397_9PEZI|nr:hypothetical protein B0T21DRAFT_447580 [Apiosordaria backusii]
MAAYIQASGMGLQEFLVQFRRNRSKLISGTEKLSHTPFDYELSFATCWSISMESLEGDDPGDLLGILSMLDPDRISEDILKGFAVHSETSEDDTISALRDTCTYIEARVALLDQGLIDSYRDNKESRQFITIHRLVQEAAIRHSGESGQLGESFDNADFGECRRITPHIASLERIFAQHFLPVSQKGPTRPSLPKGRGNFIGLLADAGWYLYEAGSAQGAKTLLNTAEKICDGLMGDKPDLLEALIYNNLGVIYDSENKPAEAFAYASKCADTRSQRMDPYDPEMGNSWNNLGNCALEMGNFSDAQNYFQKTAQAHESSESPSHDLLEGVYSSLGLCHLYQDELDDAEKNLQKAIFPHQYLSPNHFTAITISIVGMLRMKQGRWTEAKETFLRRLALRREIFGREYRLIGTCLHHIAFVDFRLGSYHEAIERLRQAILIFRDASQTRRCLLERSLLKLADCLEIKGDPSDAAEAAQLREEVKRQCTGSETGLIGTEEKYVWNQQVAVEYRCLWP